MSERDTAEPTPPEGDAKSDQTWGQGEGTHEPTLDPEAAEREARTTYSGGTATEIDDPDAPLAREDEGMER